MMVDNDHCWFQVDKIYSISRDFYATLSTFHNVWNHSPRGKLAMRPLRVNHQYNIERSVNHSLCNKINSIIFDAYMTIITINKCIFAR